MAAVRGVGQRVVPALVETAIGLGNAGVTAVTQVTAAPSFVDHIFICFRNIYRNTTSFHNHGEGPY